MARTTRLHYGDGGVEWSRRDQRWTGYNATIPAPAALLATRTGPRPVRRRRTPRLMLASLALAAPNWLTWTLNGHRGVTPAVVV
jgi:hypothetical protein